MEVERQEKDVLKLICKYPVVQGIKDLMRKNKELYKFKDESGEEHYVDFENGKFDVITIAGFVKKYLQSNKEVIAKYPIPEVLKPDGKKRQAGTFQREFDWDDFPQVRDIFADQITWLHQVKRPGFARPRICDLQSVCSELYKKLFPNENKNKDGGADAPEQSNGHQKHSAPERTQDDDEQQQLMEQLMKSAAKNKDRIKRMLVTEQ